MKKLSLILLMLLSMPAFAKEKALQIASNTTGLSAAFVENIGRTALAMGIKEPISLVKSADGVIVSGSTATKCQIKLNGEKIMGVSCK